MISPSIARNTIANTPVNINLHPSECRSITLAPVTLHRERVIVPTKPLLRHNDPKVIVRARLSNDANTLTLLVER